MAPHNGWSINSPVEDQEEEEAPLLQEQAEHLTDVVCTRAPPQCCSARYNLAFMMCLGFAVVYGLRVNLSVAMVAMVNTTGTQPSLNASESKECPSLSNSSGENLDQPDGVPQYTWNPQTQGYLLGAFFFGYIFTQIPGGYLSGRCGGSKFLGGGVLGTAILTIFTPLAAKLGVKWLFALRVLEGFGEGVTFPAMMAMWACWAPKLERARLMTISGAGGNFGAFIAFPLTGFICHSLGWPAVFYLCGGAGLLWGVLWFIMVSDEPQKHPRISDQEKEYIISSIGSEGGSHGWSLPLRHMIFSGPLWAIIITQMCSNWAYYTLLTSLPTYMNLVLHFDLRQNSFLSALPYLGSWLFSLLSGVIADYLLEKKVLSVTTVRKIFTFAGLLIPAGFLVAVGFSGCSSILAVTFLTLSNTLGGISAAGVFINQMDIAPQYAGILLGITNSFGTIPGIIAPIVVGYLTKDHTLMGWRKVFYVSAGVSGFGAIYFTFFGTGKIQSWAFKENPREVDKEMIH